MTTQLTFNPAIVSFSVFDDLGGIDEARNVQVRDNTTLDKLIDVGNQMVKTYSSAIDNDTINNYLRYIDMYTELKQKRLLNIQFNEEDLMNLVFSYANGDYESSKKKAYGMYTGCLLQLLTERNIIQGKRTQFFIDGKGNRFDYLFYYAKHVDEVKVINFSGDYICSNMSSFGGSANLIYGERLTGDYIFSSIGSYGCNINRIFGSHIKGNHTFFKVGTNGCNINEVIGESIDGVSAFMEICGREYHSPETSQTCSISKINRIIGINIKGNNAFVLLGQNRSLINQIVLVGIEGNNLFSSGNSREYSLLLNQLVAVGIKGDYAFKDIFRDININQLIGVEVVGNKAFFSESGQGSAIIRQVMLNGIYGDYTFSNEENRCIVPNMELFVGLNIHGNYTFSNHSRSSRVIFLLNCRGDNLLSNSDLSESDVLYYNVYPLPSKTKNPYHSLHHIKESEGINRKGIKILKKAHFDEILTLAKSLEGKSYQDVLDIADLLYALYPKQESMTQVQKVS